ncbi:tetratricopeptide repeat protein [Mesonia aestuariivivens]|uniref:Tetratricopeptide repeat protein n=1 Tax=Mesonia aestuariivivens TaxID=2796128 RepID=A0ABS6VYM5_9FLAO|nr:tetratricopeptide repeat protein [Mesonia aestuariivivens]MBW2960377.1 tetratricopeptide repeat protein [Mesonia aestuariivivens]
MLLKMNVYFSFFFILIVGVNLQAKEQINLDENSRFKDSTLTRLTQELEVLKKDGALNVLAKKHLQLGDFFKESEVFTEAIAQYTSALKVAEQDKKDSLQIILKNRIGYIYLSLKNYKKAENFLLQSIASAQQYQFFRAEAIAEEILGTCFEKKRDYLKALQHQQRSLELFEELEDAEGIAIVYENIGSVYEDLNQYDDALSYFLKANDYYQNVKNVQQVNVINNIGDVYRKTQRYPQALSYTQKALQLAENFEDKHQIGSAHKDLAKTYVLLKDHQKAYEHLYAYNQIQEREFYTQNFRQLNVLQTLYETEKKETQIELLTEQNKINEANQNLILLGGGAVLFFSGLSFLFINRKRKEKSKLQAYEQLVLQAELDKKAIEEKKLQDEIKLKTASLSKYSLNIAQKNKLLSDLSATLKKMSNRSKMDTQTKIKELAKELDFALQQEDEWDEFMNFFEDVHPQFFKDLAKVATSKLTSSELRLAMLLRLNLSSKEISSILRVTPDSVRVARYRLRKKLPINSKQELVHFLMNL